VTGVASLNNSPRTFLLNSFKWGDNIWNHHWEFPAGLGSISARISPDTQTGFAHDYAWNMNPNDFHADGSSKALDYIASVGVKTATNRSGVNISPYNTHNLQDFWASNPGAVVDSLALAQLNPSEMNQGEVEIRGCAVGNPSLCFHYLKYADVASDGTVGGAGGNSDFYALINISVGPWYTNAYSVCSWAADWNLAGAPTGGFSSVIDWSANLDGSVAKVAKLFTGDYRVAVNLASIETERCPSWNLCEGSTQTGAHDAALFALDSDQTLLSGAVRFSYSSKLPCSPGNAGNLCQGFLCGEPVAMASSDGLSGDWWLCSGDNCATSGDNWQLACRNQTDCVITMADTNLIVVRMPSAVRSQYLANPTNLSNAYANNAKASPVSLSTP